MALEELAPGVFRFRDTCNVYALRAGRDAILIDFGAGAVLDRLGELGVDRVTDVLLTHHHRDQLQGLARAAAAGIRIWAPPVELELIAGADELWSGRRIDNDYELRQYRFSLLESVPVTGVAAEYRTARYGGFDVYTLPTPGHTPGSVTYLVETGGRRLAFSGDLVHGAGRVWSLAATQWSYTGVEGQVSTILSCFALAAREPDVLLPSHGEPVDEPRAALRLTRERLGELVTMRRGAAWDLDELWQRPWDPVTPRLLRNRAAFANSYALLSDSGAALLIDFGYDLASGLGVSTERSARRPLLWPLDALRRLGIERIEAVVVTHYHDDHVAGLELLREVEGTEVWAPENVAPVLEDPRRYDLPCLWFEPIRVDRVLPFAATRWQEYELRPHPLPGHTLYQAAIAFEVDGKRVLATGDQQGTDGLAPELNYQYRNRFRIDDFVRSAELYLSLRPDILIGGHSLPREVDETYLQRLLADGRRLAELHRELLPLEEVDLGAEGFAARIAPYRSSAPAGGEVALEVTVRNPFPDEREAAVRLALPEGWAATPDARAVAVAPRGEAVLGFRVRVGDRPRRRARLAADVTVGGVPFGQQAEALVDVT